MTDGVDMPPPARGRERLANSPVDFCSEQSAQAEGRGSTESVMTLYTNINFQL